MDEKTKQAEFFQRIEFRKLVFPLIDDRIIELNRSLIDHGGDENRYRIKELERLKDEFDI